MINFFRLLFVLFALFPTVTKGIPTDPNTPPSGKENHWTGVVECDLEAPAVITIEDVGPTHISISWTPVKHAYSYNVRVYDITQGLPGQLIIDAKPIWTTNYTATNLTAGSKYRLEVAAMCAGEFEPVSRQFNSIESNTLIIDLVLEGYTALPNGWTPPYNCSCMDLGNVPNVYRWFDVLRVLDGQTRFSRYQIWLEFDPIMQARRVKVKKVPDSYYPGQTWPAQPVDDQLEPPSQYYIEHVFILNESNQKVARFDFDLDYPNYLACATALGEGYHIRCIPPNPEYPPNPPGKIPDQRSETNTEKPIKTTVGNPFSDHLSITFADAPNDVTATAYLFDSNGRLVLEDQIPAVQQYNLPTSHLTPGFYILKINANQNTQTFKVIKF